MTEVEKIVEQLNSALVGDAWHGPALMKLLEDVTAPQALARPLPGAHNIWEISLHITAWLRACRNRLEGQRAELSSTEDWPPLRDPDDAGWNKVRRDLLGAGDELSAAITRLDDSRLEQPILEGMRSVYVTLHGVIQHSLYHAGQIAILRNEVMKGHTI